MLAALLGLAAHAQAQTPDTTAPELLRIYVGNAELMLLWSQELDEGSAPAIGAFSATVGGLDRALAGAVAVSGKMVTLALASPVEYGHRVTVGHDTPRGSWFYRGWRGRPCERSQNN